MIENPQDRPMTAEELSDLIPDVDAAIAGVDTWNEPVFQMAKKLKVIARFGVGIDNIDVKKAHQYGIKVTNAPRLNANAVAELTVGLIFSVLRNIPSLNQTTKQGKWERFVGDELNGKMVGLLGFGNIPQKVAHKLQGFEVRILAFDKYPNFAKAKQYGVKMASLEEVIGQSDIVCMHLPSIEETRHTMNDHRFGLMKEKAYFINTARGSLVDEKARCIAH
ncbi:NAD(P)-dependent oxidoreductase [Terrilactibacillus sp. S3-3]|nr:NAD(P)-dependent oxidoreductase [Terrilactibacillus sp. S3-3]